MERYADNVISAVSLCEHAVTPYMYVVAILNNTYSINLWIILGQRSVDFVSLHFSHLFCVLPHQIW